ncbi:MAG: hypothetical protein ACFFBV_09850 [Promethearchaeota archaeon]
MKVKEVFRSRIVIFIFQVLILTLFVFIIGYEMNINFDIGVSIEQEVIMKFLANFLLFNELFGLLYIYFIWILVSLIPILIYNNFKKAYSMNLMTFFFPNFFLYIFLSKHSPEYFNSNFQFHFLHTILLGIIIVGISIGLSLILRKIKRLKIDTQIENLHAIASTSKTVCPNCGTEFESIPKFCYNCNTDLTITIEDKSGKEG